MSTVRHRDERHRNYLYYNTFAGSPTAASPTMAARSARSKTTSSGRRSRGASHLHFAGTGFTSNFNIYGAQQSNFIYSEGLITARCQPGGAPARRTRRRSVFCRAGWQKRHADKLLTGPQRRHGPLLDCALWLEPHFAAWVSTHPIEPERSWEI